MIKFIAKHPISVIFSILLHISIVAFFSIHWEESADNVTLFSPGEKREVIQDVATPKLEQLKTFTVDSGQVQAKLDLLKQEQETRLKEQQQLAMLTEKSEEKLKDLEKKKRAEQAKAEAARKQALQEKRKAERERRKAEAESKKIAEAKRLAEKENKKAEEARKKADQAKRDADEAEKQRKQEKERAELAKKNREVEEQKKKQIEAEVALKEAEKAKLEKEAEAARIQKQKDEAEAALQARLAEESRRQSEAQNRKQLLTLRQTYISSIKAKVNDNWRTPARISPNAQCDLKITQTPKGMITSVEVLNCNEDATRQFKKAAEKAVYRAEPLPPAPKEELFEREIKFMFKR